MTERDDLYQRDAKVSWHPYTQHGLEKEFMPVARAYGATLELEDGRTLIDAISSWWATLHGHGDARLVGAVTNQMQTLDHVLFAGTTHEPAVKFAEELIRVAPDRLSRVFYSDDGSTAVEVGMKMAYHRHVIEGQPQRTVFLALEGGYHGDTFGAMAVGDRDPFFLDFEPLLFEVQHVPPTEGAVAAALERLGDRACAVISEPRIQGAAGMHMHPESVLREIRESCDQHGIPWIADEVFTGFGRTGQLFATRDTNPDILCLAKGLTGGMFPMAATLATEETFQAFLSDDNTKALFHGHTFTANPVGCAVGIESLRICLEEDVPSKLATIGDRIHAKLESELSDVEHVKGLRKLGGVVAYDVAPLPGAGSGYFDGVAPKLRARAIELGVLIRPLGNAVYTVPPACTTTEECDRIADALVDLAHFAVS